MIDPRFDANQKVALRGKAGLGAAHVFGDRVDDLTRTEVQFEPDAVRRVAPKLDDLPEFEGRQAMKMRLVDRADRQSGYLDARATGEVTKATLTSRETRLVADAAEALAALKGALIERFPRQLPYVMAFFLDVGPRGTGKTAGGGTGGPGGGTGGTGG